MKKFLFQLRRLKERLWFKPLLFVILSIGAAFLAHLADGYNLEKWLPDMEKDSLKDLLETLANSMLVIAIFAVASMLSAFSAASGTATPRSFQLIASDDLSQNALSVFIGSFIYGIVAGVSLKNGFYGDAGLFTLFVLTLMVFVLVILTFLRWVERISKLGRLDHTIQKVEKATLKPLTEYYKNPLLGGTPVTQHNHLQSIFADAVGYVQTIDVEALHKIAEKRDGLLVLNCLPGVFITPDKPIAFATASPLTTEEVGDIQKSITIGRVRLYDEDPRFGLIALSEIGSRALSPGINDPGTAIAIIGSQVRIFCEATSIAPEKNSNSPKYPRVQVPALSMEDMLEDAFRAIARDGASTIEVMIRLQKAFRTLAALPDATLQKLAVRYSQSVYKRAAQEIKFEEDLHALQKVCL